MTAIWRKLGRLFSPEAIARHNKLLSHAANPLPVHIKGNVFRIFFSGRDRQNRSSVGAVDVDIVQREVIEVYFEPVFEFGPEGSFFQNGVSIGNCYRVGVTDYMLFMGWNRSDDGHWRGDIGRLIVGNDLSLRLDSADPFLASERIDPISLSYPWVMAVEKGVYRMWYGSTRTWDAGNGEMLHVINSASSVDGHRWSREGLAVPYVVGKAQAFSRPTVSLGSGGRFDMWFSYRSGTGQTYRIGYAFSPDGRRWNLDLQSAGIDVSPTGWDSEMIEYPFVFSHGGKRYMLYNGNGFGKTGFGLAEEIDNS